jgi:phosphoribosyl 1,2-cyclic phosphate phosphodiesterase
LSFFLNKEKITPVKVLHNKLSVMGYRIRDFAYLTDVKTISENELKKLKNLDVLVINALKKESHISHLSLDEAIEIIKKLNPNRSYITHISHLMGFHDEIEKSLPTGINLAYDNLKIVSR